MSAPETSKPGQGRPTRRRNQMLAAALVSVISCLFVTVVGLVILLHYAELHHIFTAL